MIYAMRYSLGTVCAGEDFQRSVGWERPPRIAAEYISDKHVAFVNYPSIQG